MRFLHGLRGGTGKTTLGRNPKRLNCRRGFEQSLHLVWVGQGNLVTRYKAAGNHNLKSLYPPFKFYFWSPSCFKMCCCFMITPPFTWQSLVAVLFSFPIGKAFSKHWTWSCRDIGSFCCFSVVTCCLCLSFLVCSSWAEDAVACSKHLNNTVTLSTLLRLLKSYE